MSRESCIVYGITLLLALLWSWLGEKTGKRGYMWLVVLLLTLLSGLRGYSVGFDTKSYVRIFHYIDQGIMREVVQEKGFVATSYLLMKLWKNPSFLLFVYAGVTQVLIIRRLWDFREESSFTWMVLGYYMGFFCMTMNIMRQFLAVAMVFFGTRYLERRNYRIFAFWICLAVLFHTSSLLAFGFFLPEFLHWGELKLKHKVFLLGILGAALLGVVLFFDRLKRYALVYLKLLDVEMGFMLPLKLLFYGGCIWCMGKESVSISLGGKMELAIRRKQWVKLYYPMGILIMGLDYFFTYVGRSGLPFYLFECVFFGMAAKDGYGKWLIRTGIICILAYEFFGGLLENVQGQVPYLFFWQ